MKKIYLLATVAALLSSCRSVGYEDLTPSIRPNNNLLPVLEVKTDTKIYPKKEKIGKKTYNDSRGTDAETIFIKEVRENIIEPTGEKKGYITMRISYEDTDSVGLYKLTAFVGCLGLGVPFLFGVPAGALNQDLEVEVQIQNNHKDVIKRYTERVADTEYVAAWWGYKRKDVSRKVAAENLKHALENIRYKINNDAPTIRAQLK